MGYGTLPLLTTKDGVETNGYPIIILNPEKTAVLNLPTNAQLTTYLAAQYSIVRAQEGSEDVPTPKADKILFDSIRIDKGEEFDDAEISYALGIITQHRVAGCERDGQTFVVSIQSRFGDTSHVLGIPTQKQMADYRKNLIKTRRTGRGVEEWRYPISVPVGLYDALAVKIDGYNPSSVSADMNIGDSMQVSEMVPVHHKRTVIDSIITAMGELDPNVDLPNS